MRLLTRRAPLAARVLVCGLVALLTLAACTATVENGQGAIASDASGSSPGFPSSGAPSSGAASESGTPSAPAQAAANFHDCKSEIRLSVLHFPSGRLNRLSFDCAVIDVPLDYAHPKGRTVSLQLVRIHDSANTGKGSLLVNPGGPGGSGVELVINLSTQLSDTVLSHYDLVGFDPRGVGLSTPISCISDKQKDVLNAASPDVRTAAGFTAAEQSAAGVAKACSAKYGSSLAQFNTVQTARDMDQIRQAVGDSSMHYLGFSYGTELGAQYAHLFPSKVGVMVLDGAVDPLTDPIVSFTDQLKGFEDSFDQFATWCTTHSPCRSLGNARTAAEKLLTTARRTPIPSSKSGEQRKATFALVATGILSALYSEDEWPALADALISGGKGDSAGLLALADNYLERQDGHYTNIFDANLAISCNDEKAGPSNTTIRTTTADWAKRFPLFGLWSAASLFGCQQWQPDRTVPALPTAKDAAHPLLVIGNLHDPATPYQGAKDLTTTLGRAELLTWDGEGHTSYLQSSCIDGYVNTYLVSGQLPPAGKVCPR